MRPGDCPPDAELTAFHAGGLAASAIDRVSAHLEKCSRCEEVLQSLEGGGGPLTAVLRHPTAIAPPPGPVAGAVIAGRYKLVEPLGEGGMGSVWMAQQTDPIRRAVAVKLIKPGMDSKAVLARFEAERQALALMDHANIARVLDAGATTDGRPFFVMDLVKGIPITRYCDDHKLTVRERLELFVPVCQAVQHAHQKGVIHRDLKPSNILVARYDDRPVPKVIDFGVAKAAGQPLTDRTLMTGFGAVVGTPEYMSPEQATFNALDVDTRTDVYALGVLLYELLTGTTPLSRAEVQAAGLLEALRLVRETDPPRPSTRLSTTATRPAVAAARGTDPHRLAGLVRGELDWIVLRAMEKDRARRYPTANGLAADVERYLAGEPVQAVPPTVAYRLRKLVRRHKGPVLAAGLVLLALVGGVVGTTVGLVRAETARQEADDRRAEAVGQAERALAAERRAAADRDRATADRDRAEAERVAAAGVAKMFLWDVLGQADPDTQADWREVVNPDLTIRESLDYTAAQIGKRPEVNGRAEVLVRWAIGDGHVWLGQPAKAVPHLTRAHDMMRADPAYGPAHGETLFGTHKLVVAYRSLGRPDLALPLAEEAAGLAEARYAREPTTAGRAQGAMLAAVDVGLVHLDAGRPGEAVRQLEAAERWVAENYPRGRNSTRHHLGRAYRAAGRAAEARPVLEAALAGTPAGDGLTAARFQETLGRVLLDLRDWAEAEQVLRDCLATRRRRLPKAWTTPATATLVGAALLGQGRHAEAETLLLDGYRGLAARADDMAPADRPRLAEAADRLVELYFATGRPAEATRWRAERAKHRADLAPPPRPAG